MNPSLLQAGPMGTLYLPVRLYFVVDRTIMRPKLVPGVWRVSERSPVPQNICHCFGGQLDLHTEWLNHVGYKRPNVSEAAMRLLLERTGRNCFTTTTVKSSPNS